MKNKKLTKSASHTSKSAFRRQNIKSEKIKLEYIREFYLEKSLKQLFLGNFTEDVTLLGTGLQIGAGIFNLDLLMDIRDLTADFCNWEWSWGHLAQTTLDLVGLLPVVGVLKYGDEAFTLAKHGDELALAGGDTLKVGKNITLNVSTSEKVVETTEEAIKGGSSSTTVSKLTSTDVKVAIEKNGMSVEDFSKLLDPNRMLTPDELKFVDKVRADVGLPQAGTVMNKTIPQRDIYNYLYNEDYRGVRGFVSVDEHSNTLKTLDDVFEGNRLDYNNTAFKTGSGVDGISQSVGSADTVYGKITYVLEDADSVKVPTDVPTAENAPYTGRGFTGSKNIVLPELVQDTRPFVEGDILGIYDAKTGTLTQQLVYDSDLGWLLK